MKTILLLLFLITPCLGQTRTVPKTSTVQIAVDNLDDTVSDERPLPVSNKTLDFGSNVALELVDGYLTEIVTGRNSEIDTTTDPEAIWEGGGVYTGHPVSTTQTVNAFSSSPSDTSAGTGARTIRIRGLKSNTSTVYETEDITMNGTTAVTSSNTWWRIVSAWVLTAGTNEHNAGIITIRHTTATTNVFCTIQAGIDQAQALVYTVPYGSHMLLKRVRIGLARASGAAGSADVTLRIRNTGGVFRALRHFEVQNGPGIGFTSVGGDYLPALTDIKCTVESVSDSDTIVEGVLEFYLIED